MKAGKGRKFCGIIPPVVSLFTESGDLDRVGMATHIDFLINAGVDGLFFLGSGGEFSQMSEQERREFAEFAIGVVSKRVPVLIGVGSTNMREAVNLARHAEQVGADGILAINPYYWSVSEANLFNYFGTLAECTSLPLIIYNFPAMTGQDLTAPFVKRLVDAHPSIVGIKDTVDSVAHLRNMINIVKRAHPDFSVLCGYDDHLANTLLLGGDGAISISVNFAPDLSVGIYDAYQKRDMEAFVKLSERILQVPSIYQIDAPFITAVKEAMIQKGMDISSWSLPPASKLDSEAKSEITEILRNASLL